MKFLYGIIIVTVLLLGGAVFLLSSTNDTSKIKTAENAKVSVVEPTSFDWGKISMSEGLATKSFTIKSTGTETLKLFNIKTSCHCTKARIEIDGNNSPDFGMDSMSSWVGDLGAGKEAKLTVIFDQNYHGPQGVGPINRFVSVETNDSSNKKLTFTLTGVVVK